MPKVKLFINDVPRRLIKAEVTREGIRAVDQSVICVPPETPVCASDRIVYVQDMVDLNTNRIIYNYCQTLKDESGYNHNPIGHTDHPSPLLFIDYQCELKCEGSLQNCITLAAGCNTFIAGKVHLSGIIDRAFCFDGSVRYLTMPDECEYDLRQDQKFSLGAWVYPTVVGAGIIIAKRDGLACCAGYSLSHECNTATFEIGMAAACFTVTSAACSIPLCMWTHVFCHI